MSSRSAVLSSLSSEGESRKQNDMERRSVVSLASKYLFFSRFTNSPTLDRVLASSFEFVYVVSPPWLELGVTALVRCRATELPSYSSWRQYSPVLRSRLGEKKPKYREDKGLQLSTLSFQVSPVRSLRFELVACSFAFTEYSTTKSFINHLQIPSSL